MYLHHKPAINPPVLLNSLILLNSMTPALLFPRHEMLNYSLFMSFMNKTNLTAICREILTRLLHSQISLANKNIQNKNYSQLVVQAELLATSLCIKKMPPTSANNISSCSLGSALLPRLYPSVFYKYLQIYILAWYSIYYQWDIASPLRIHSL